MIKGTGQRLIPEELLKYLETYKEYHPDPTQGGGATLDDIVDAEGNKRFIEGNLTIEITEEEVTTYGFTPIYNKWSLSGTHLMIVSSFSVTAGWTPNKTLFSATVPDYIYNKVFPIVEGGFVSRLKVPDSQNTDKVFLLNKGNNNKLEVYSSSTFSADRAVRVQFDLLIDTD